MSDAGLTQASADVVETLKEAALSLGFPLFGIAPAARPDSLTQFQNWLAAGHFATMEYLPRRADAYVHPRNVLANVRSIIMLGAPYASPARRSGTSPPTARVAAYAQSAVDYHDVLRNRLRALANRLHELHPGARTRGVVDTAPLLERDVARRAGLGWFGKNTMLIHKGLGSYFFLCGLLTDLELPPDAPHATDHCGTCTRCLSACPTDAFTEPHVLDAARCISYLTIELRGAAIPADLREGMGNWLFGCDVCQEACPWNRFAPDVADGDFAQVDLLAAAERAPERFLTISAAEFTQQFGLTPLSRPGRAGLARNAAIVLGNLRAVHALPQLQHALKDPDPWVRGAVAWALGRLQDPVAQSALQARLAIETDASVRAELHAALQQGSEAPISLTSTSAD